MQCLRTCVPRGTRPLGLFVSGWEYSVDVSYGVYGAIQKAYHLVRRRRWVRERLLKDPKSVIKQVGQTPPSLSRINAASGLNAPRILNPYCMIEAEINDKALFIKSFSNFMNIISVYLPDLHCGDWFLLSTPPQSSSIISVIRKYYMMSFSPLALSSTRLARFTRRFVSPDSPLRCLVPGYISLLGFNSNGSWT